ncbi:MAG: gamma-glutamylcyclotransferase [Gammaproteobacteria bacterium]|nr:gamma-glutamylcyclotransferase [Gammaproteobacteria bacterium]
MRELYFAYGSNMLTRRLRQPERAPSAVAVAVACLRDHRLTFAKRSHDGSGKCDAEHTGNMHDCVYGIVFEMDTAERRALDRVEGVGQGYGSRTVEVVAAGATLSAFTYYATITDATLRPYHWYKAYVTAGAAEHGLPQRYQDALAAVAAIRDPDEDRCARALAVLASGR